MLPAQAALLTSPEAEVPAAAVGRVGRAVLSGLAYYITSATRVLCKRNDATPTTTTTTATSTATATATATSHGQKKRGHDCAPQASQPALAT